MFKLFYNLAMLGAESAQVIGLRVMKIGAGGSRARKESRLMVSEKKAAATQAVGKLARGTSPTSVVKNYRKKVQANRRRLSK